MAGIGVAMENIDGMVRVRLKRFVDFLLDEHAAHWHRAVGDTLGEGDHVGGDAVTLGGKAVAEPPEAGDDLVEDQQDAVAVAYFPKPRGKSLGPGRNTARTPHRLHNNPDPAISALIGPYWFQRV